MATHCNPLIPLHGLRDRKLELSAAYTAPEPQITMLAVPNPAEHPQSPYPLLTCPKTHEGLSLTPRRTGPFLCHGAVKFNVYVWYVAVIF